MTIKADRLSEMTMEESVEFWKADQATVSNCVIIEKEDLNKIKKIENDIRDLMMIKFGE